MFNIRENPETNSSSSHAIAKGTGKITDKIINFCWGTYGWEVASVAPKNYLWTSILMTEDPDYIDACKKCLTEYLKSKGVNKVTFEDYTADNWSSWNEPSIDHQGYTDICERLIDYDGKVATIHDELVFDQYITGTVYTGNDNAEEESPWSDEYRYSFDKDYTLF